MLVGSLGRIDDFMAAFIPGLDRGTCSIEKDAADLAVGFCEPVNMAGDLFGRTDATAASLTWRGEDGLFKKSNLHD